MDVRDVRRLALSTIVLSIIILVWLLLLYLQDRTNRGLDQGVNWQFAINSLDFWSFLAWQWVGAGAIFALMLLVGLTTMGVSTAPAGYAQGSMRQVQCQDCRAVFYVHDMGHRPLTHRCPNCKALGVYDGKSAPIGDIPAAKPAKNVVELKLSCQSCNHKFAVTDTGARPLDIKCPNCEAKGVIR